MLLILALLAFSDKPESVSTAQWPEPVHLIGPTCFAQDQQTLLIWDAFADNLKAYDLSQGFAKPRFRWCTPGIGKGPGEIPTKQINNIAFDEVTSEIWISHKLGYTVFDDDGQFLRYFKAPYNTSRISLNDGYFLFTTQNFMQGRDLATFVQKGKEKPLWRTIKEHGYPINKKGSYISEDHELLTLDDGWLIYFRNFGRLYKLAKDGQIAAINEIGPKNSVYVDPVDYLDTYDFKRGFSISSLGYDRSGAVFVNGHIYLVNPYLAKGFATLDQRVLMNDKLSLIHTLVQVDPKTLEPKQEYAFPLGLQSIELIGVHKQQWLIFADHENGDLLHFMALDELQPLQKVYF